MAYLVGVHQYFDDSFLNKRDYAQPKLETPNQDEITNYLDKNFSRWYWIMKKARRALFFQKDADHMYTMFIPEEDTFSNLDLMNYDIDTCLRLFNRYVIRGRITNDILYTSPIQQLSNLENGHYLYYDHGIINNTWKLMDSEIQINNLVIHPLQRIH